MASAVLLGLGGCGGLKESTAGKSAARAREQKVASVLKTAESYLKTPYKYGGTTRAGLDCSALMQLSWRAAGVELPRSSKDQSQVGKNVHWQDIKPGDMLFFATGRGRTVTHAGLVVTVTRDQIRFIHAATRGGVRIDDFSLKYWRDAFLFARRLI